MKVESGISSSDGGLALTFPTDFIMTETPEKTHYAVTYPVITLFNLLSFY